MITSDKQIDKLLSEAPRILKSAHKRLGDAHKTATNLARKELSNNSTARSNLRALSLIYGTKANYDRDSIVHFPQTPEVAGDLSGIIKREKTPLTPQEGSALRSQRHNTSLVVEVDGARLRS